MPSWLPSCGESGHHTREGVADKAAKKQRRSNWGQGRFFQSPFLMRISSSQANLFHVPSSPLREVPDNRPHEPLILNTDAEGHTFSTGMWRTSQIIVLVTSSDTVTCVDSLLPFFKGQNSEMSGVSTVG